MLSESRRRQGIFWILTVPAPNELIESIIGGVLPQSIAWIRGQLELGGKTGYLHYQVVVAFSKKMSKSAVTKFFGPVHAELTVSARANTYVGKEETRAGPTFELGAKPIIRSSKPDWESVWTAAQSGDLARIPASIRVVSYRTIRAIGSDFSVAVGMVRQTFVFWGPTGTGKSRSAWDEAGDRAYAKCPRTKFWDGYQSEESVVIDEFRGGFDVSHLLRWTDRYPVRVEVKGSSRPLHAKRIFITSNLDPRRWYPELDPDTLDALMRRLTITYFNKSLFN